jgi:pyrophosphatase PpaX
VIRGVIFDLDGTLLDSMPLVFRMFGHAISPFAQPLDDDQWRSRLGGPPRRILEQVLQDTAHVAEALIRLTDYEQSHSKRIPAFDGMKTLLEDLRHVSLPVGLWTGRDRRSTQVLMDVHGIGGLLSACVCGDDLASHKPDPEGLNTALGGLGVNPTEALFVGDSEVDVLAGAALGVRTLWISHNLPVNPSVQAQAWRVVDTPSEAYTLIRAELIHRRIP